MAALIFCTFGCGTAAPEPRTAARGNALTNPGCAVASPGDGATAGSPVSFDATCTALAGHNIVGIRLYVSTNGGVTSNPWFSGATTGNAVRITPSVDLPVGSNAVTVQAWDDSAPQNIYKTPLTVLVVNPGCVVNAPASGSTVTSPFVVDATCTAPGGHHIVAVFVYDGTGPNPLSQTFTSANSVRVTPSNSDVPGNYPDMVVQAWDDSSPQNVYQAPLSLVIAPSSAACTIASPADGAAVAAPVGMRASCTAAAGHRIAAVDVLVDGVQAWHAAPSAGATAQVLPALYPTATGAHTVVVRGTDEAGGTSSASIGIQLTASGWDPWLQIQAARLTSGPYAGAFMINPAADAINWYFANVGLLGFADRFPDFARAHVDAYLAARNADATIDDVDHPLAATPTLKPPDSDDSYAATLLSLAVRYVNVTDDLGWLQANLAALKAIATDNLLHAQQSNGLVHVFQDPNHLALNAYTEDNCEVYKGLHDFAGLLSQIADADAPTYANAASAIASAIHGVLFIATAPNGPSSGPGFSVVWNGATNPLQPAANAPADYYPRGVTQLFPAAYQVPVPAADNDAAWNYAGGQFPSWWSTIYDPPLSQGGASDPFAVAGYGAALRGQTTQATGVQQLVRSNVANGIAVPINDFGFYERITQVLNGGAPY